MPPVGCPGMLPSPVDNPGLYELPTRRVVLPRCRHLAGTVAGPKHPVLDSGTALPTNVLSTPTHTPRLPPPPPPPLNTSPHRPFNFFLYCLTSLSLPFSSSLPALQPIPPEPPPPSTLSPFLEPSTPLNHLLAWPLRAGLFILRVIPACPFRGRPPPVSPSYAAASRTSDPLPWPLYPQCHSRGSPPFRCSTIHPINQPPFTYPPLSDYPLCTHLSPPVSQYPMTDTEMETLSPSAAALSPPAPAPVHRREAPKAFPQPKRARRGATPSRTPVPSGRIPSRRTPDDPLPPISTNLSGARECGALRPPRRPTQRL
jgi:hypothetical protein